MAGRGAFRADSSRGAHGAPVGAIGAVIYVLCVEWALPSDNALIASILMINWSGWAVWFVGFTALTDSLGCSWRLQQLLLTLHCAIPLIGFRFSQESIVIYRERIRHGTFDRLCPSRIERYRFRSSI